MSSVYRENDERAADRKIQTDRERDRERDRENPANGLLER